MKTGLCRTVFFICFASTYSSNPPSMSVDMEFEQADSVDSVKGILRGVNGFLETFLQSISSFANAAWSDDKNTRRSEVHEKPKEPLSAFFNDLLHILSTYDPKDLQILLKILRRVLEKYDSSSVLYDIVYDTGLRGYLHKKLNLWIETPQRLLAEIGRELKAKHSSLKTYLKALDSFYNDAEDLKLLKKTLKDVENKATRQTISTFIDVLIIEKYNALNYTAKSEVAKATSGLSDSFVKSTTIYNIRFFDSRRLGSGQTVSVNKHEKDYVKNSLEKVLKSSEEEPPIADILTDKPIVLSKEVNIGVGNSSFFNGKLTIGAVTVV